MKDDLGNRVFTIPDPIEVGKFANTVDVMEKNLIDIKVKDLRELLHERPTPVHFSYRKADGTIREAQRF